MTHIPAYDAHVLRQVRLVPRKRASRLGLRGVWPAEGFQILPAANGTPVFVSISPSPVSLDGRIEVMVVKGKLHAVQRDPDIVKSTEPLNSDVLFELVIRICHFLAPE